jgi:hypothetical protein
MKAGGTNDGCEDIDIGGFGWEGKEHSVDRGQSSLSSVFFFATLLLTYEGISFHSWSCVH